MYEIEYSDRGWNRLRMGVRDGMMGWIGKKAGVGTINSKGSKLRAAVNGVYKGFKGGVKNRAVIKTKSSKMKKGRDGVEGHVVEPHLQEVRKCRELDRTAVTYPRPSTPMLWLPHLQPLQLLHI